MKELSHVSFHTVVIEYLSDVGFLTVFDYFVLFINREVSPGGFEKKFSTLIQINLSVLINQDHLQKMQP